MEAATVSAMFCGPAGASWQELKLTASVQHPDKNHLTSDKRGAASLLRPARSPSARLVRVGCVTGTQTIASIEEDTKYSLQFRRISPCICGGRHLFVMEGSREQFFSCHRKNPSIFCISRSGSNPGTCNQVWLRAACIATRAPAECPKRWPGRSKASRTAATSSASWAKVCGEPVEPLIL
jgi:hypothetical protein